MADISAIDALGILAAAGSVATRTERDLELPVEITSWNGVYADGVAPRLQVARDMELRARILAPDGSPWVLVLRVDRADYLDQERAEIELRPVAIEFDRHRRIAQRQAVGGAVWLEALTCQEVVDGDRVDGTMMDVSTTGVAFATTRVLRKGDILMFHGRFFTELISAEVRVASVRPGRAADLTVYGCSIVDITDEDRDRLARVVRGERATPVPAIDFAAIRDLVEDGQGGGWRKRLRRAS
jgi:hypothetical protein